VGTTSTVDSLRISYVGHIQVKVSGCFASWMTVSVGRSSWYLSWKESPHGWGKQVDWWELGLRLKQTKYRKLGLLRTYASLLAQPFFCIALPYGYGMVWVWVWVKIIDQWNWDTKISGRAWFKRHEPFFLGRSNSLTTRAWHQVFWCILKHRRGTKHRKTWLIWLSS